MAGHSPMHHPSDEQLAERAQGGCVASLEELLRRYQAPVLQFLRHRGARSDAEDLLQETFLRVCTHLARYRSRWRFRTWLFTIARRVGSNDRRRRRPAPDDEALRSLPATGPGPAEAAAAADSRRRLWQAAAGVLSEHETTALWLHYVEDLSLREVAAVLERPWIAVKVQVFRARKKLLPELRRLGYAPLGARQPAPSSATSRTVTLPKGTVPFSSDENRDSPPVVSAPAPGGKSVSGNGSARRGQSESGTDVADQFVQT